MKKIEYYINIHHYVIYTKIRDAKVFLLGIPDVTSGRLILLLSLIPGIIFFNIYMFFCEMNNKEFQPEFIFLYLAPFVLLVWFSVIHKDKYQIYFKEFEKKPKKVRRKWAWTSFSILVIMVIVLIASFWILTNLSI